MDLGLAGRSALVCASSAGLGLACAQALAAEGVAVTINGRDPHRLEQARAGLAANATASVSAVAGDISTDTGRALLLESCPAPDILVNNNGGPPPKFFADADATDWDAALAANMLAPLAMIRAVLPGMVERGFGRIVNITSAMVMRPMPHQVMSTTARTGLTAACKAISKDVARHNVTINNLLPERIDTGRQQQLARIEAERAGVDYDEARRRQAASIAARRHGTPAEFGATCAFLCSKQAGFISGSNFKVDGGSYPGLV